ncbi:MAG: protein-disulfide reductase DsbD [Gammaproteobacteria bacterium]|nr:protein-disulfide reductase DsbD [Gammaproteobacteria bacterium]
MFNIFKFIILFFLTLTSLTLPAKLDLTTLKSTADEHPTVDQAFTISVFNKNNKIQILVNSLPNTYIYQNSLKFTTDNKKIILDNPVYPPSEMIVDDHYGKTNIFKDNFEIIIPYQIKNHNNNQFSLTMDFQGCLKDVLCYPPKQLSFNLQLSSTPSTLIPLPEQPIVKPEIANIAALSDQKQAVDLLNTTKVFSIISGFIIFGLLLSLTPCVLPMLPILSGIIAGHKHNTNKKHAFILSFVYVFSMALTYMLAGILVAASGINLISNLQHPVVIILVCLLFLFLAVASFGIIELKLPDFIAQKLTKTEQTQKGGTYTGVAIMGVISALIISPCATAPLAGALLYISSTGNIWLGAIALFSMGFAMGIPLLLFGTTAGHWLPKAGPWMKEINIFFGVVFIGLAIYIITSLIYGPMTLILWGLLLIFYAVHLGLLEPADHGWQRIKKGMALVSAIYGGFLLAGALQHNSDVWHPFGEKVYLDSCNGMANITNNNPNNFNKNTKPNELSFIKINTIQELTKNLVQAKTSSKFTVLTFYADWCVSCRKIEQNVFSDPKVKTILENFQRLQVDLTRYNTADKKIMTELSVFNPPTLIFYDRNGQEIANSRVTSEIAVDDLYNLLKSFG